MTKIVVVKGETWLQTYIRTKYDESPNAAKSNTNFDESDGEDSDDAYATGPEFEFDE